MSRTGVEWADDSARGALPAVTSFIKNMVHVLHARRHDVMRCVIDDCDAVIEFRALPLPDRIISGSASLAAPIAMFLRDSGRPAKGKRLDPP